MTRTAAIIALVAALLAIINVDPLARGGKRGRVTTQAAAVAA